MKIPKIKINRQFIFATHNANIPVFGDAELIVTMENENDRIINNESLGSIDNNLVREFCHSNFRRWRHCF